MGDMEELVEKYFLHGKTDKVKSSCEDLSNLIIQEKFWNNLLDASLNNVVLKEFFSSKTDEEKDEYFKFGIACLYIFIQSNFTGPPLANNIESFLAGDKFNTVNLVDCISTTNEEMNVNTKYFVLLMTAEVIFDCCEVNSFINWWWCCRAVMIHQDILDEPSPTLLISADRLSKLIQSYPLQGVVKAELDIELTQMYHRFRNVQKSKDYITSACEILGLEYSLMGKLGKRTKYQNEEIAQLTLQVTLADREGITRPEVENSVVPQNFSLNDEIRLDHISYAEGSESIKLPNTEQKLLLAILQQKIFSSPIDELQTEEIFPFLELVLSQQNSYPVRIAALLLRCKYESKDRRAIERCLKQCEDIISYYDKDSPPPFNRISDMFGTASLPLWKIKAHYGDVLLNYGLVKNSLELNLQVQRWEEVIICYTILRMREKAAEVIKQQIEIKPTVKMMCLLGDATDDTSCYEKAWEMSRRRSHKVQRHWGQFFFARKKYEECIPHFEKSLSINPLQPVIWLNLGYAALEVESWQTAATAYRRHTSLEPDSFAAWNNLGQAYIKIGNKRGAHQAILEALRCNYDNWKVWENLLIISTDISKFSDVIRAYHRLIELREKYLNIDVLNVLVYHVTNNLNDYRGASERTLLQKTRELVGRVTALYPNSGAVWELYASLAPVVLLKAQRLQRAYRGYTQGTWDKEPKTCIHVLNVCSKLGDIVLEDEIDPTNTIVNSVKLNLSAALAAIKKHKWEETAAQVIEVSTQLELIIEKMQKGYAAFKIRVQ